MTDRPVFVLSSGRSGSTLLSRILNSHPSLYCPAETNIGPLIQNYLFSAKSIMGLQFDAEVAIGMMRRLLEESYLTPMREHRKSIWCDKSLPNAQIAKLLQQVWPDARFICLYRHCMDTAYSAIKSRPWGLTSFGLDGYVQATPANLVLACARYWLDWTTAIHTWETEQSDHTLPLRYEDLVRNPTSTLHDIWEFLEIEDVAYDPDWLSLTNSDPGPGDHKIQFENQVHTESIGHGMRIPSSLIPNELTLEINQELISLGYVPIGRLWGRDPIRGTLCESPTESSVVQDELTEPCLDHASHASTDLTLVDREIALSKLVGLRIVDDKNGAFELSVALVDDPLEIADPQTLSIDWAGTADPMIVLEYAVLVGLWSKSINFADARNLGYVRHYSDECPVCFNDVIESRLKSLAQYLSANESQIRELMAQGASQPASA